MAELKLRKTEEPTFFNKEMAIGLLVGLALPVSFGFIGLVTIASTIVGGFIGQNRMEKEKNQGKTVSDKPSFWNKDTLLGGLIGHAVSGLAMLAAGAVGIVGTAAAAGAGATGTVIGLGVLGTVGAMVAAVVGTTMIGAYIGGKLGQKKEKEEFEQATTQQQPQIFRQPGFAMDMNPAFAAQIEQQRALAASQEKAR